MLRPRVLGVNIKSVPGLQFWNGNDFMLKQLKASYSLVAIINTMSPLRSGLRPNRIKKIFLSYNWTLY